MTREIPTIGVINGRATHAEICLMCAPHVGVAEEAVIFDPHFTMGSVPGDGIDSLQEPGAQTGGLRNAHRLRIDAKTALERAGMVNEVLPRAQLLDRAWKLADHIMTQPSWSPAG